MLLGVALVFALTGCVGCKARTGDTVITLEGDSIRVDGTGTGVEGDTAIVWSAGTYIVSGTLDDGQIMVNAGAAETVNLVLSGASISCSTSAPIYVVNAEEVVITLAEGTENSITDGAAYVFTDTTSSEPSAAVFSKDDLTIDGSGSLTVNANYNNGIQSKDDLLIRGGSITVNAVSDAIKGKDSVVVTDGTITVNAGSDGIQSNNDVDAEKGYVSIEGGTLNITAAADGIQAETDVLISSGNVTVVSGGGGTKTIDPADTAKGVKAVVDITVQGGNISIDSADDALHSDGSLTVNGGNITLASGDGALHADGSLAVNGVVVRVTRCSKTIESASVTMTDGGDVQVVAGTSSMVASS